MNRTIPLFCIAAFVITACSSAVAAELTPAFTFQGVLTEGGIPVDGARDLRLTLYDTPAPGGTVIGSPIIVEDAAVTDGRFSVLLDFGGVFANTAFWIEVGVRDAASTGSFAVLAPRRPLTAAPQAWFSKTADDAEHLNGEAASYYLAWSNLVGVPPELTDGDDDTLADLSCANDQIARWNGSVWQCGDDLGTVLVSTHVVSPVGTPEDNGHALRGAIAALPAGSEAVYVEPGTYDLLGTPLELPHGVHLVGFPSKTVITSSVCAASGPDGPTEATLVLGDGSGLRDLVVRAMCPTTDGLAVAVLRPPGFTDTPTLESVTMFASAPGAGAECFGLYSVGVIDISRGTGAAYCFTGSNHGLAIEQEDNSGLGFGAFLDECYGVVGSGGVAVRIALPGAVATNLRGSTHGPTVFEIAGDNVQIRGLHASGDNTSISIIDSDGVVIEDAHVNGAIEISGSESWVTLDGVFPREGAFATAIPPAVNVSSGAIVELTGSRLGDVTVDAATIRIGASRIGSVSVTHGGIATCAGVWNSSFSFFASTCP